MLNFWRGVYIKKNLENLYMATSNYKYFPFSENNTKVFVIACCPVVFRVTSLFQPLPSCQVHIKHNYIDIIVLCICPCVKLFSKFYIVIKQLYKKKKKKKKKKIASCACSGNFMYFSFDFDSVNLGLCAHPGCIFGHVNGVLRICTRV